jgi:hypothetical protein
MSLAAGSVRIHVITKALIVAVCRPEPLAAKFGAEDRSRRHLGCSAVARQSCDWRSGRVAGGRCVRQAPRPFDLA